MSLFVSKSIRAENLKQSNQRNICRTEFKNLTINMIANYLSLKWLKVHLNSSSIPCRYEYTRGCSKRIAYCVVARYPYGTWKKLIHTCKVLSNSSTMMCTCARKSDWKKDNFPFDFMQSLNNAVKMVGKSFAKKKETRVYIKTQSNKVVPWNKHLLKFLLFTDILICLMTRFVWHVLWHGCKKKFDSGLESIENVHKSGRPKSASYEENVSKQKKLLKEMLDIEYCI